VIRDGQPVPETSWGTEQAKVLLAYLLWKGPWGATRKEISEALWPARPVEETGNVFHVTLHRLRRVLEPDLRPIRDSRYILFERRRYYFNFDAPYWLDVDAFQSLATSDGVAGLEEAIGLYRGDYLQDIAWTLPSEVEVERRRLEQSYADVLRRLVTEAKGRKVLTYLEKLLAVEPADETAQQAIVLDYLTRGRRDLAQRQIARWQAALAEVELEPSAGVRELWERVEGNNR
jgi:DNA-binding SARP family transcriptional activator